MTPSFTLEDLLNEQELTDSDEEDLEDIFEDSDAEEVSDTKPSKRSYTLKSVSLSEALKAPQVSV